MTVSECLKEWLRDYENLDISDLLTDFIDAPEGCLALFKSPSKEERTFLDGSKDITEYYNFFCKKFYAVRRKACRKSADDGRSHGMDYRKSLS